MDLLRLTLSRLPLTRLINLKALLRSDAFLRVRMAVINPTTVTLPKNGMENYLRLCTLDGELWQKSFLHVNLRALQWRAVFLRYSAGFRQFRDYQFSHGQLWKYLESDVPEIQARALTGLVMTWKRADYIHLSSALSFPADALTSIHWTPQLKKIITFILSDWSEDYTWHRFSSLLILAGFLRIPYSGLSDRSYVIGYLLSFTNGDTVSREIPECDDIILKAYPRMNTVDVERSVAVSGYINPSSYWVVGKKSMLILALQEARLPLIRKFSDTLIQCQYSDMQDFRIYPRFSRKLVLRIREVLDDVSICEKILVDILEAYRVVAGEIFDSPSSDLRVAVGNRPPRYKFPHHPRIMSPGLGIGDSPTIYDPVYSFYEYPDNWRSWIAYARGLGSRIRFYPEDLRKRAGEMGNPEIAKLVGVADDTENSRLHEETYREILAILTNPALPVQFKRV